MTLKFQSVIDERRRLIALGLHPDDDFTKVIITEEAFNYFDLNLINLIKNMNIININ